MKKILVSLVILALCAPAMAATTLDVDSSGSQIILTLTVSEDDVVRGLAVAVEQSDGDLGDMKLESGDDVSAPDFNTYIDYAFSNPSGYDVGMVGQHAAAKIDRAGAIDDPADNGSQLPASAFSVSAGYLDQGENQGGLDASGSPYTITIDMTGTTASCFDVSLDALRGGIVGDDLEITDNTGQVCLTAVEPDCYQQGGFDVGDPEYDLWASVGKPICWCYVSQCHGDANGTIELGDPKLGIPDHHVGAPDLTILADGWQKPDTDPDFATFICADFNHTLELGDPKLGIPDHRVGAPDLTILAGEWQSATTAEDCLTGTL